MKSRIFIPVFLSVAVLLSCKKKEETKPSPAAVVTSSPDRKAYLTGNGSVKYWQAVSIGEKTNSSYLNLYLTSGICAVDNYFVFFSNGDYEERGFGTKCFNDERLVVTSYKWETGGDSLKINGINGGGTYEITSTLFSSKVTIKELDNTRFKGFRVKSPGDTIFFTLSAVPM